MVEIAALMGSSERSVQRQWKRRVCCFSVLVATLNIDKVRTGDLAGNASTATFTNALVSRIAIA